jgi:hypothetical protein
MEAMYETLSPEQRDSFRELASSQVSQKFVDTLSNVDPAELARFQMIYGDQVETPEFWQKLSMNAALWELLKPDLTRQEVALMDKVKPTGHIAGHTTAPSHHA